MKELLTTYRYPTICLSVATIAFFAFLVAGIRCDAMLFARGASIVVLFSAAAEYGLLQIQQEILNKRIRGLGGWDGPVVESFDIPHPFPRLRVTAHIYVVVGTFVWGFGDLLLAQ
jgi:hypothetical protein